MLALGGLGRLPIGGLERCHPDRLATDAERQPVDPHVVEPALVEPADLGAHHVRVGEGVVAGLAEDGIRREWPDGIDDPPQHVVRRPAVDPHAGGQQSLGERVVGGLVGVATTTSSTSGTARTASIVQNSSSRPAIS